MLLDINLKHKEFMSRFNIFENIFFIQVQNGGNTIQNPII